MISRHALASSVRSILTDVAPEGRSWPLVGWVAAALAVFALLRGGELLRVPDSLAADGHAIASLNAAVNERFCGRYGVVSSRFQIGYAIATNSGLAWTPIRRVVETEAGTVQAYCESLTSPFTNNENSLSELMYWVLAVKPDASAQELSRWLSAARLMAAAFVATALFAAGGSVLLSLSAIEIAVMLMYALRGHSLTLYGFFFLTPFGAVAVYILTITYKPTVRQVCAGLAIAGLASAFGANMRTSHAPIYAVLAVVALTLLARRVPVRTASLAACVFAIAFLAGNSWIAWRRVASMSDNATYTHHVIGHPLVLSLALPPSDLSRREGIEWNDSVGLSLAQKHVPTARYLGSGYEGALLSYYFGLWRRYPVEMVGIYVRKLGLAGEGMWDAFRTTSWPLGWVRAWSIASDGFLRLWLFCVIAAASAIAFRRWRWPLAAATLLLTVVAVLLYFESAFIVPYFVLKYNASTALYCALIVGILAQTAYALGRVWVARRNEFAWWNALRFRIEGRLSRGRAQSPGPRVSSRTLRALTNVTPTSRSVHLVGLAILIYGAWLLGGLRPPVGTKPLLGDNHAVAGFTHAVDRAVCGLSRSVSDAFQTRIYAATAPTVPVRQYIADVTAGTPCLNRPRAYINNENGTGLLMQAALHVNRDASAQWVGSWLHGVRIVMIAAASVALIFAGLGFPVAAAVFAIVRLVSAPLEHTHAYSLYPFLLPSLTLNAAFCLLVCQSSCTSRMRSIGLMVAGGFLAGFASHIRTSHAPIMLGLGVVSALVIASRARPTATLRARVAFLSFVMAFVTAYLTAYVAIAASLTPSGVGETQNSIHHPITHPLVLALGIPETELAVREGIAWDDATGMILARRVNPSVRYLTSGYADALRTFYLRLWREYPWEMLNIYWLKSDFAGRELLRGREEMTSAVLLLRLFAPPIPSFPGQLVGLLWVLIFTLAFRQAVRTGSVHATAAALIAFTLVCFYVEATIILPTFTYTIHAAYAALTVVLTVVLYAAALRFTLLVMQSECVTVSALASEAAAAAFWTLVAAFAIASTQAGGQLPRSGYAIVFLSVAVATCSYVGLRIMSHLPRFATIVFCIVLVGVGVGAATPTSTAQRPSAAAAVAAPASAANAELSRPGAISWQFAADVIRANDGTRIAVDGTAAQRYSYLLLSEPLQLAKGQLLIADGSVEQGGFTIGLQDERGWAATTTVSTPGVFKAALRVPTTGEFTIVLANATQHDGDTNRFTITSLGLTAAQ